jgi:rhodanese-related sulfurtransferase
MPALRTHLRQTLPTVDRLAIVLASKIAACSLRFARANLIIAFGVLPALSQEAPKEIKGAGTLDSHGVIDLILKTPDLVVVDTRKRADFDNGHIEGAINISDDDMSSEAVVAPYLKSESAPVLFYCNGPKCGRAANATRKAIAWGYSNVFYYALGVHDWISDQLPLVTSVAH